MGPTWGRQDPGGLFIGNMNFANLDVTYILDLFNTYLLLLFGGVCFVIDFVSA